MNQIASRASRLAELGRLYDGNEAMLAAYVADPAKWLQEQLDDPAARSKMTFKLAKGDEDMAAYLASLKQ